MSSSRTRSTVNENLRRRRQGGLARPAQMALVAMGGVLLIYAQAVAALGVGEPRYLSHLFEPLRVDVPVDTKGVDPAAVKVGIHFSGVDPAAAAEIESRLHREWRVDERGNYVLRISTDQPIHEPLMQMRVEVGDDRIQAVRELTLLFDPAPVDVPAASLLAEAATPAVDNEIVAAEPVTIAAEPIEAVSIANVALIAIAAARTAPATMATPRPAVATAPAIAPALVKPAVTATVAAVKAPVAAAAPSLAKPVLIASPKLLTPLANAAAVMIEPMRVSASIPTPQLKTTASLEAQIASTRRAQALSSADRWQRLPVAEGDTLADLAERARGNQTSIPLPMVAMLLRWLNPRSFDGVGSEPLVGAELRFPKAESLAAQIAISGGVWTVDDVTASTSDAASAVVPPPSFQVLTPQSAAEMAVAMQAGLPTAQDAGIAIAGGSALLAARPAAAGGLPSAVTGGRVASTGLLGGAVVAGLISVALMLTMVVTTPVPQASRYVPASVVARSVSASASATASAAKVLLAESVDLAALDLASFREAERVRQQTRASDSRGAAES